MNIMPELLNSLNRDSYIEKCLFLFYWFYFIYIGYHSIIWLNQKWFYYVFIRNSIYTDIYHISIYILCPYFNYVFMQFGILEWSILSIYFRMKTWESLIMIWVSLFYFFHFKMKIKIYKNIIKKIKISNNQIWNN